MSVTTNQRLVPVMGLRKVLMSEELFRELGASRVDWGQPDADGFYTPSVYVERCNCPEAGTSGACPFHDGHTAVLS